MAVPEGYTELGRIGFVDRGNYAAATTYRIGDVVYYSGSSWTPLKDNIKGIVPAEGVNWKYLARGFADELLSLIMAIDKSAVLGTANASVNAQSLLDAIADRVMTKLLLKTDVISSIINDSSKAASMAALFGVNQSVTQLNSDLTTAKNDISAKPSMAYVDKINDQAVGTPLLNSGATILENIMSRYNAGLIKGGFPVAPQAGTTTGVADRPAGADSYGYVSWFKMSSDEIWVIYYAENTVKQYNRLIVTGKWQSGNDWVLA